VAPHALAAPFHAACARLDSHRFARALWSRQIDVWSSDPAVQRIVSARLGWLRAAEFVTPQVVRLRACADAVRRDGFTDIVLLGMGGSSLAPDVLRQVCGPSPAAPRFHVLDSIDPDAVRAAMARAGTTLFVLASKSGSTIEPTAAAAEAKRRLVAEGHRNWGTRFVAITDEDTALHRRAVADGLREIFLNPADIGGRYSALSFFGMVPAALMGLDVDALLAGARQMDRACRIERVEENPGLALGALMAAGAEVGRDKLTILLPPRLQSLGLWIEQLVAESTGKHGKGIVPVVGEPPEAAFGQDRLVVACSVDSEDPPGIDRLAGGDAPHLRLQIPNVAALGAEFLRWEIATATSGWLMGINPFDEPNVQQAKDATRALLDVYRHERRLRAPEPHASLNGARLSLSETALAGLGSEPAPAFLRLLRPNDYFGLLAYLPSDDPDWEDALHAFRAAVATKTGCATTSGYGPRYLHSTGQLHKGGPNHGVFLIVTAEPQEDLAVPDEPYSFAVLETAQALGDFQSLSRERRRVALLRLPRRSVSLFGEIAGALVSLIAR